MLCYNSDSDVHYNVEMSISALHFRTCFFTCFNRSKKHCSFRRGQSCCTDSLRSISLKLMGEIYAIGIIEQQSILTIFHTFHLPEIRTSPKIFLDHSLKLSSHLEHNERKQSK